MKTVVIYGTKYGTTKQYAEWIAEELNADLLDVKQINPQQILSYDRVVFGGGLYAGGIVGVKTITKNMPQRLVVFTVGLADPLTTDYSEIIKKAFTEEQLEQIKIFHLRGGIDYSQLSAAHKMIMAMLKKSIEKNPAERRSSEDKIMLETYGQKIDFSDKKTIQPIVECCCS